MRRLAVLLMVATVTGALMVAAPAGAAPVQAAAVRAAAVPNTSAPFTLVTIPDTQNYVSAAANRPIMGQQTQWIVRSRSALNTVFVSQLGDIVGIDTNQSQWQAASQYLATLDTAGVPNTVLPGNHDMSMATGEAPLYRQYFPVSRYAGASWNGAAASYGGYLGQNQFGPDGADRQNLDSYALFTAGGMDFLLLNLEFDPPDYAIDWARRVLAAYPARRAIVATHSYVDTAGAISSQVLRTDSANAPNSPQQLWQKLIAPSCSIFMVINGHFHDGDLSEARRTDTNACGKPVLGLLSDYQERANGGDGWLRYYTFRPADNTIQAVTYSPSLDRYETDADSAFTVPYDMSMPAATPTPRVLAADSFARTTGTGWGTAETGGAWTVTGSASRYSVAGGQGVQTVPAAVTTTAKLAAVSSTATDLSVTLKLAAVPNGPVYVCVGGRVVGSADLSARAKITTDSTAALQSAGAVQLTTYLSSSATNGPLSIRYDDLAATALS